MERLIEMVAVLGILYAGYALGIKRWGYATQADVEKRRTYLKEKGLANTFYFIHAGTLFVLIVCSGGAFMLYWAFQQWKAVLHGFKRTSGGPLKHGPFLRALCSVVTFFTLAGIINRTCEYMRKQPAWPAAWWGTLWIGGLFVALLPLSWWACGTGFFIFCLAPAVLQHHLNALPKTTLPLLPKPREVVATILGLTVVLGALLLFPLLS